MTSRSTRSQWRGVGLGVAGVIGWLGAWQWFTTAGPLGDVAGLPPATSTVRAAVTLGGDGDFWLAVGESLVLAVVGLAIALVLGLVIGVGTGASDLVHAALDPAIQMLRPIPPVVLLPLVLLVVGPSATLAVTLAAVGALWPILVQTSVGVRCVDPVGLDTARAMRLSWLDTQRSLVLPSALPYIVSGLRISTSLAVMLSIGAGILGGSPGLGRAIATAQQTGQPSRVFGMLLWAGLLGLVINTALGLAERRLTRGRQLEVAV